MEASKKRIESTLLRQNFQLHDKREKIKLQN